MSLINRHEKMLQFEKNADGKYQYVGNWQILREDGNKETKKVIILLCIIAFGIISVGLLPGASAHTWYVMAPYAFSFLTAGLTTFYSISFMISHWVLMEQEHKNGLGMISAFSSLTSILMFATCVGQIIYICGLKKDVMISDIFIVILAFATSYSSMALRYRVKHKWHWELISEMERQRFMNEEKD